YQYTGVENRAEYDANVKALRDSLPVKSKASGALSDMKRALQDLKTKHYSPELIAFDAKLSAFEEGTLGVPDYAAYLDSVVPATGHNTQQLIQAAMLEGAINFDKVETERSEIIKKLVEKMS